MRLRIVLVTAMLVALTVGGAHPSEAKTVTGNALLGALVVKKENTSRYDREKNFGSFIDANGDCQDTRSEVLQVEATRAVAFYSKRRCAVKSGRWTSWYDQKTWTKASDLDIDHVVALAEAWDSGAQTWSQARRVRYANDLWIWTLDAVTDDVNASKGDRDATSWLPAKGQRCKYARHVISIKYRWRLTIDTAEKRALTAVLKGDCGKLKLSIPKRAK